MPAFTFEKIPPPVRHTQTTPGEEKQRGRVMRRGLLVQFLDRFAEVRVRRSLRREHVDGAPEQKPE
jgi:hypothetical protein